MSETTIALEKHYTPAQIAEMWNLDVNTVRNWFKDEPGVIRFGTSMSRPGKKRAYLSLRIPESVALRVHTRRSVVQ